MLRVAGLAAHPQKAVFQPATFQKFFEFPLYITRQYPAPGRDARGSGSTECHRLEWRGWIRSNYQWIQSAK